MKNLGLLSYASLVSTTLNNEMEILVNPIEETKNAHYVLPIYQSKYKRPLSLELIFNYQNLSTDFGLGKGIRTNYLYTLSVVSTQNICLTSPDGSTLVFTYAGTSEDNKIAYYKSNETASYISADISYPSPLYYLYDKYKNITQFTKINGTYVSNQFRPKNGERFIVDYDTSGRVVEIKNNAKKIEKLTFDYDTNDYVLVQAWKTNKAGSFVEVKTMRIYKHTTLNYLNFLQRVVTFDNSSSTTSLKDYVFSYSLPNYCLNTVVTEQKTNLSCEFKLSTDGLPMLIKDEMGRTTTFTSIDNFTTRATDYRGKESELIVDGQGRLTCVKDNFRFKALSFLYDENNKLISTSQSIHYNSNLNGKLQVFNSDMTSPLMSKTDATIPSFLSSYYQSNKWFQLTGSGGSNVKYIQIYNIEGSKFDVYSLGVWAKVNSFNSESTYATINIYFTDSVGTYTTGKQFTKEIKIKPKDTTNQQCEFYMTSAFANQSYKYVVVELSYINGPMSMDICLDLFKRGLTTLYEYDDRGNQITKLQGRKVTELVFNNDNSLISSQSANYQYDLQGNVIKITTPSGKVEEMTYDDSNNLLTHKVIKGTHYLYSKNEYIDEETVEVSEDNNDVEKEAEHTNIYQVSKEKQKYDTENMLYEVYGYSSTNKGQIASKTYKENDTATIGKINYTYLSNGKLSSFYNNDGNSKITLMYDGKCRNYAYKINNNMFSYNSYQSVNGVPELIASSGTGMKDSYSYTYDTYDRLIKVTYSGDSSSLFEYTYDENDNIKTVKDCKNNITYTYEYDENNNMISYSYNDCVVNSIFDENESLCIKEINIGNEKITTSNHSSFKSNNKDFNTYLNHIRNKTDILLGMFDDLEHYQNVETEELNLSEKCLLNYKNNLAINSSETANESYVSKDGFITVYNLNSTNPLEYNLLDNVYSTNSVAFAIKPTSSGALLIINGNLKINLNSSNKIEVVEQSSIKATSMHSFAFNTWHFVCVTYSLSTKTLNIKIDDEQVSASFNNVYNALNLFKFGQNMSGKLTNIMIPITSVITEEDYDNYYKSFKYLVAVNESCKDTDGKIVKKTSKEFTRNLSYDYIPLNNGTAGFKSNTKILPIKDSVLELPCLSSKNSEFVYDDKIGKNAYFAMGQELVYNFGQSSSGTISLHANRLFIDEENVLFDLVDNNQKHIKLSIVDSKIVVGFADTPLISNTVSSLNNVNQWNVITLTWNKKTDPNTYEIVVFVNQNKVINTTITNSHTFNSLDVHVGRESDETSKYGNCFNGLIEMLVFSNLFVSSTNLASIISAIQYHNKVSHEYDVMDFLKKSKILDLGNEILKNEYVYRRVENIDDSSNSRISPLVSQEKINNTYYTYDYDERGNLKHIRTNGTINHTYTYDSLGRLLTADDEKYHYDSNGNITKVTNLNETVTKHTYGYDSSYTDLLTSFDGQSITYDTGNTYNPIKIGPNKTLTYQCRRLASFQDTINGFYNLYYYDDLGNRTKKVVYNNIGTLLDTIYFYYDENGKLIHQKSNTSSMTFLYDDLNQLYGFIYNGNRYYYIKNAFNTILGIVDSNGNNIVKYNYDAWGNILSTEDTSGLTLGNINPFRYKCYYYDVETHLFYCNSRYYSPELCRFISPDSIEYLDPQSINGLNLYAYCMNNPIMYADPSGHSPTEWWEWALAGVAVAGLIVGSIFTCGTLAGAVLAGAAIGAGISLGTQAFSGELNWGQFALDTGVGAITGLIGGSGVSRGVATILGGVVGAGSNFASQLIKGTALEDVSIMQIMVSGLIGAASGFIGGAGARNKAAINQGKGVQSATKQLNKVVRRIANGYRYNATTAQVAFTNAMNGLTGAISFQMGRMFATAMVSYGVSTLVFTGIDSSFDNLGWWFF